MGANPRNYELEFYKKLSDGVSSSEEKLNRLKIESSKLGVKIEEKSFSLEELLLKMSLDCIPIVLLDWNKVKGKAGYHGHFVPVVGYDKGNVYVHNSGEANSGKFMAIKRSLFDEARKAEGTDEDIVFIYRRTQNLKTL